LPALAGRPLLGAAAGMHVMRSTLA